MESDDQIDGNKVKSCLLWTRMITVKVWQKTFLPQEYKYHFEKLQVVNDMDAHECVNVKTNSELKDIKSGRPDRTGNLAKLYGYRYFYHASEEGKGNNPRRKW